MKQGGKRAVSVAEIDMLIIRRVQRQSKIMQRVAGRAHLETIIFPGKHECAT